MVVESCSARFVNQLAELALKLRGPARKVFGSVRSAVVVTTVLFGAYLFLKGALYPMGYWYGGVRNLVNTECGLTFISAITHVAVIFGILSKKDQLTHYISCAALAVAMICLPISLLTLIILACNAYWDIPLWEIGHLGVGIFHTGLIYCLLVENRGDPLPNEEAGPPPEGWLKNNFSQQTPPPPHSSEPTLKAQSDSPAVISPSVCTTAPPPNTTPPTPPPNNTSPPNTTASTPQSPTVNSSS